MSMVCYHWGSRSPKTAYVKAPASWPGGGVGGSRDWQYNRRLKAAAGAAALVSRQWSPPASPQRTINKNDISKDIQQKCCKINNHLRSSPAFEGKTACLEFGVR